MRGWLVDRSALIRIGSSPDADQWSGRAQRGLIRIATPTVLEEGYSARSEQEWNEIVHTTPISWLPVEHLSERAELRALEVQGLLVRRGQHRAPSVPDLLIAAAAETAGLTVLHVDKDFELIAEVTGQAVERLRL
ncbi:MAG: PIN domain nuclease [Microbacterium sp.]